MRVTDLCPSPHLEALDIGDKIGDAKTVTIKDVAIKEVGAEKEKRGVVFFEEYLRGMVLTKRTAEPLPHCMGQTRTSGRPRRLNCTEAKPAFKARLFRAFGYEIRGQNDGSI